MQNQEWYEDDKYWFKSMFAGDVKEPDIPLILAEHRKRVVSEIKHGINSLKIIDIEDGVTGLVSPRQAFMVGQMNFLVRAISLPELKDKK